MRRHLLRSWLWKPSVQEEVDEELAFHLEMRTREYAARGLAPDEARRAALRRFGDLRQATRVCRHIGKDRDRTMKRREYFAELRHDLVFGARQLMKARGFAAVAILTLALGIGATAAVFSTLYAVVLSPLPVREPERLVSLGESWRTYPRSSASAGNFLQWKARLSDVFESLTASQNASFNLAEGATPERVPGSTVSRDFFRVFAMPPLLGRTFGDAEDAPGREQVVVLSHRLWSRRFGADPGVVGRTIRLNGRPYAVLGVMPAAFDLTADSDELWTPIAFTPDQQRNFDIHFLSITGRLRPGITIAQARARLVSLATQLRIEHPIENSDRGADLAPFLEAFVGDASRNFWLLLGAVALVLLIACVNVANLLVARGTVRGTELAIRAALGAGRARLVRQLLAESLLLALLGSAAGLLLAGGAVQAFVAWSPPGTPRLDQARLDPVTVAFTLGVAVASALLFGLAPALRGARPDAMESLKTGRSGSLGARHDRLRTFLVATEVALVLVLLVSGGLLLRSALSLQQVNPGFDPSGVIAGRVSLPADAYRDSATILQTLERLTEAARQLPGVTEAALVTRLPMGGGDGSNGLLPDGRAVDWANPIPSLIDTQRRGVTPGYFATMRVPIARGRAFTDADRAGAQKVMIVNETFAARAWPGQDPVGKRVACCERADDGRPTWKLVVGVAADVHWQTLRDQPTPEFYLPLAQSPAAAWDWDQRTLFIVARAAPGQDPGTLALPLRRVLAGVDATVPLFAVKTMDERLAGSLAAARFNMALLLVFGCAGLLLAVVGIYGVIAYFVSHRTQEIGVRLALGASPGDVVRLVIRQGLRPVLWGIGVGLLLAAGSTQVLAAALFGVTPRDPLTMAAVAIALLVIALAACWLPARRATRIDPTRALQST
jgi:predicted permease